MGGPVRIVRRVEHPRRGDRGAPPAATAASVLAPARPCPSPTSTPRPWGPAHRRRRARPGARRRLRAGVGHAARRRAGHRQVARCCCSCWPAGRGRGTGACYVSAEESAPAGAAAGRAARRAAARAVAGAGDVAAAHPRHIDEVQPDVVVVDSIQTVHDPELGSAPGLGRAGARRARTGSCSGQARGVAIVLVGHVTKDGGARRARGCSSTWSTPCCRSRATATTRCGCCGPSSTGSAPPTSSACSRWREAASRRARRRARCSSPTGAPASPGSVVVPAIEGQRPLLVEVQALVAPQRPCRCPRRVGAGRRRGRLAMLLAVLEQRAAAGDRPARRLRARPSAACSSPSRASTSRSPGDRLGASPTGRCRPTSSLCGEVGLGGELRQVAQTPRRLAEAARLGFRRAIVPASAPEPPPGIELLRASTVAEARRAPARRPARRSPPEHRRALRPRNGPTRGYQQVACRCA